jgi:heat shock protein 5
LIGRRNFSDPLLLHDIKDLSYDVVEKDGRPSIKVQVNGVDKYFAPEEVSAMVIDKLKNMAQEYLTRKVTHAVVTVPTHFNDTQRQATRDAGAIAGLTILRMVNEPTSAGISHGLELRQGENFNIFYNLGAKESNVALEDVDQGVYEVLAHTNDQSLGGEDFQNVLLSHAISQYEIQKLVNITKDSKALKKLKSEIEKAEQVLMTEPSATIQMPAQDFSMFITQTQVQELNKKISERALDLVNKVLQEGKVEKREVNNIIFTGNPAHVAKIQTSIEAYLDGKKALSNDDVRSDETIVHGAAIQGSVLSGYDEFLSTPSFPDLILLSLGIETSGGIFTKILPRYSIIPTLKIHEFTTITDGQEKVMIKVLEGERAMAGENGVLGTVELTGLPLRPRGVPTIEVMFQLDPYQALTVVVTEKESGKEAKLLITGTGDRYTWEEVDKIMMDMENHWEADQLLLKRPVIDVFDGTEESKYGLIAKEIS